MSRAGYVLVGGASSRMGRDKALLPYRGRTLAQHVANTVEAVAGSVILVGNPCIYNNLGYHVIADPYPGEGPLGGIVAALRHTSAEWTLLAACDLPEVSTGLLERILRAGEASRCDAVIPAGPTGRPEPLCAAYRREALVTLEAAFARGARKVAAAVGGLAVVSLRMEEDLCFQNVNTPEEWAGYAAK